jgi:hypothetical protein
MRQELEDNGVKIQKTSSSIMNNSFDRYNGKWVASPNDSISSIKISGVQTSDIVVGQSYELDNNWHTSRIERIIDNCIIVTKNSIYAIHNLQQLRERKIKDLGI